MADLSIVIVNYNSGNFLSDALLSIREFPPSLEWEVHIIDNCSTDDSMAKAESAIRNDPHFTFIHSDDNLGFAAGNNRVIESTSGRLILLLNPDTKVTENALNILIEHIEKNPDYGAVGPRLIDANSSTTVSFGWLPSVKGILADAFLPKRFKSPKSGGLGIAPDSTINEPLKVGYVSGACLLTKREIWNTVGSLDKNYFAYFEETDWCMRLSRKGYRVMYIPHAAVHHFEGKSFSEIPFRKMEIFVTSAKRFFKLHYPGWMGSFYITVNIIASALKIIYLVLTGWAGAKRRKVVQPVLAHHRAFLRALIKYGFRKVKI